MRRAIPGTTERASTGAWLASRQRRDGLVPWTPEGPADPWNHIEAAMALECTGNARAARRAYRYLLERQRSDGALPVDLTEDGDGRVDTNAVAYFAAGVLHHFVATGDRAFARAALPACERALTYVLDHRIPGGAVAWSVEGDGTAAPDALVAASSSIVTSLRAAARLADLLGREGERWRRAADGIADAVVGRTSRFLDKDVFAMDWYYPVLSGALPAAPARAVIAEGWPAFVTAEGVRCRSDGRWVTTAETAEVALTLGALGDRTGAARLLRCVAPHRSAHGAYLTGVVYPEGVSFPSGEESTYSAAAVLLAIDLLTGGPATEALFGAERRSTRRVPVRAPRSSVKVPESMASR